MTAVAKVLVTGPPRSGKTTLTKAVVSLLRERGELLAGFTTGDIKRGGRRTGFTISGIGGLERRLAVRGGTGPRVGSYSVDVAAFEEVALLEIENGLEIGATLVVDEIGKMELLSERFSALVPRIMGAERVLATAPAHSDPFSDALKARTDIYLVELPSSDRAELAVRVADLVVGSAVTSR